MTEACYAAKAANKASHTHTLSEIKRITVRVLAAHHKALAHTALDLDASLNQPAVEAPEQYALGLKGKEG